MQDQSNDPRTEAAAFLARITARGFGDGQYSADMIALAQVYATLTVADELAALRAALAPAPRETAPIEPGGAACGRCGTPVQRGTEFCAACSSQCHESADAFHRCAVCADSETPR